MHEIRYKLSISPDLVQFRSELEYACDFLDACYIVKRSPDAEKILHYGAGAPPGSIHIPGVLFSKAIDVSADGLRPISTVLRELALLDVGGLKPNPNISRDGLHLDYDALGLIFLLLSRLEERDSPERDRHQRFSVHAALFPAQEGLLFPVADEAAERIASMLTGQKNPSVRTKYAVKLTHDVDILYGYHRILDPLRDAAADVVKRRAPIVAMRRLSAAYLSKEPWQSARRLMNLAEDYNLKSCFYFMGPTNDPMDSPYFNRSPRTLQKLAEEIKSRDHIIGYHPGYYTATNLLEWNRQKEGLERLLNARISEGRQHVLRYDAAITPRIWSDSGMAFDCTPAYPEVVGFRTGTCRPHHAYDLVRRKKLPLLQHSTAVMEFGLFGGKYRNLNHEQAVTESVWAAKQCQRFGGTLVILFHLCHVDSNLWHWLEDTIKEISTLDMPNYKTSAPSFARS